MKGLPRLNKKYLANKLLGQEIADYPADLLEYPERVIQFGEGNFLRAFMDWFFHEMNKKGIFQGRAVVIQPISQGRVSQLNEQDGLYTLLLRGLEKGQIVNKKEVMTGVSRGLNAYTQWGEILRLAEDPAIEFVVSNTTEAGIVYSREDRPGDNPPNSFPGKLTAYLYHRYRYFGGARDKGMIIIPAELIEGNGDQLRAIVLKLAEEWALPEDFKAWVREANVFLNTLVDRIVTGYPFHERDKLEEELGYGDENIVAGEIFHLLVIEGDKKLQEKLPFHEAGLNVIWVDNLTPYRERKVRILNGAHTSAVAVSFLAGIDLVREAVQDKLLGKFIRKTIFENIIPAMDMAPEELEAFATEVLERFANPFIDHKWLDISLNSIAKFKARVLPSLLDYIEKKNNRGEASSSALPRYLVYSLAALINFYRGREIRDNSLLAERNGETYLVRDDIKVLEFFAGLWGRYFAGEIDLEELAGDLLANQAFWGQDLNEVAGLRASLVDYLAAIEGKGLRGSLLELLES